jgi:MoaA/NifB/PqqE/SkfB family radical SAM enzyme
MKTRNLATKVINGFLKYKMGRGSPLFVSYNVTGRCNMKCLFCEWWKNQIPELSTKEALRVIDVVCSLEIPFFDLSGGEPLLRNDLEVLAKRIASNGCLVSMNTNGTLLGEKRAKKLAKVFDTVIISLDGPKKIHDKIRGVPGTYEKAVKALQLLKANGVRVGVNCVATPLNIDILPGFIEELRSFTHFVQVQPVHPYPPSPVDIPTEKQVSNLVDYLIKLKRYNPGFLAIPTDFIKGFKQFFEGKSTKICDAGRLYIAVNPEGKLLACPARSDIILHDIMNNTVDFELKNKKSNGWNEVHKCKGCWLECTVGVSMMLKNPFGEASDLFRLWRKN